MPPDAELVLEANSRRFSHTLAELLDGSRAHVLRGWRSEALLIHRALPVELCRLEETIVDGPGRPGLPGGSPPSDAAAQGQPKPRGHSDQSDCYRVRVAQHNGQWAWSSPIWVTR